MAMLTRTVLAVAAHPDDIELMMAGTLFRLHEAGWQIHYLNIANGSCGTTTLSPETIVAIRTGEARRAASMLGATFHAPLVDDLMIYVDPELTARLGAIVREVQPSILLVPSPQDYMEDHQNAQRAMVTAAFCRGMRNFVTHPDRPPFTADMAVYHALPYGLRDTLRQPVIPEFFVDIEPFAADKRVMLACHRSQKEWLDISQGLDSYLDAMQAMDAAVGRLSGRFVFAEGWRRHSHLGFGPEPFNPLADALRGSVLWNPRVNIQENTNQEHQE